MIFWLVPCHILSPPLSPVARFKPRLFQEITRKISCWARHFFFKKLQDNSPTLRNYSKDGADSVEVSTLLMFGPEGTAVSRR